jgi:hypothetical protein
MGQAVINNISEGIYRSTSRGECRVKSGCGAGEEAPDDRIWNSYWSTVCLTCLVTYTQISFLV